jgi:hypothetical protein
MASNNTDRGKDEVVWASTLPRCGECVKVNDKQLGVGRRSVWEVPGGTVSWWSEGAKTKKWVLVLRWRLLQRHAAATLIAKIKLARLLAIHFALPDSNIPLPPIASHSVARTIPSFQRGSRSIC